MGTSRAPQRAAGIRILSSSPRPNKMDEDKRPSALLDHAILVAFSNLKTRSRLPFVAFSNLKIRIWRLRVHVNRPQDTGSKHPQTRQSSSVAFSNLNTYPHHGHASSDFRDALKLFVAFSNLKVAFGNLTTAIGNLKTAIGNLKDASSSLKDAFNGPRRSKTLRVPSLKPLKASRTYTNPKDTFGSLTTAFHSLKDTYSATSVGDLHRPRAVLEVFGASPSGVLCSASPSRTFCFPTLPTLGLEEDSPCTALPVSPRHHRLLSEPCALEKALCSTPPPV
ncbi:hypothetical protein BD626DRAFT_635099 [Schizophyllum amplum]|uniref:Uncharacterized protein n=1 Tax=Schizophyllum amplum TaxID=97359 RepID=A0A550BX62_9AGAR|nr:hypothetical protein BD626DRAFT_635099 [Auriculariopsis ampla]